MTVGLAVEMSFCMRRGSQEVWIGERTFKRAWDGEDSRGSVSGVASLVGPLGGPWREREGSQQWNVSTHRAPLGLAKTRPRVRKKGGLPDASAQKTNCFYTVRPQELLKTSENPEELSHHKDGHSRTSQELREPRRA